MLLNSELIDKSYRKSKRGKLIGVILAVLAGVFLLYALITTGNSLRNIEHLNDVIIDEQNDHENRLAYLDMAGFFQFATYGDDIGYYIAYDDDFYYLVKMKEKDFDYFANQYEDNQYVRAYGYTEKLPTEGKSYAIETLNEEVGEDIVSYSNFDDVFGDIVLSAEKESRIKSFIGPMFHLHGLAMICALMFGLLGVILIVVDQKAVNSYRQYETDSTEAYELSQEIANGRVYNDLGLILTDKHLISANGALKTVSYDDIIWAYPTAHSTNGIRDYNYLNICLQDGGSFTCGNGSAFGKKRAQSTGDTHSEILTYIGEKNPLAHLGYDREFAEEFFALQKELKKKK